MAQFGEQDRQIFKRLVIFSLIYTFSKIFEVVSESNMNFRPKIMKD